MAKRQIEVDLTDQMWAVLDRLVEAHPHVNSLDQLAARH